MKPNNGVSRLAKGRPRLRPSLQISEDENKWSAAVAAKMYVCSLRVGASVGAQAICIIGHLAVKICFFLFLQENE